jgi:DNA-binding SARP family transcriptional activator/TolB-like protein
MAYAGIVMADQGQSRESLWTSEISLALLGPVRLVNLCGDDLTPKPRKTRALLAIVALSRAPVSRARLSDLLWGDRGDDQARASLRQALYEVRAVLGDGPVVADRQFISLGAKTLSTDVAEVERLIARNDAQGLADALESSQWPPLADLDDITPELDEWLREERGKIAASVAQGAVRIAEAALGSGRAADARRIAHSLERIDPLDEAAAQIGIRGDLAMGDRATAVRRHSRLAARLRGELGIEPSPDTEQLLVQAKSPPAPVRLAGAAPATDEGHVSKRWLVPLVAAVVLAAAALALFLLRPPAVQATPTVAVLPFQEERRTSGGYLASGVSDEILNLLADQKQIRVLGRMSSGEIAARSNSLATAQSLGITHLVDGSVRSAGDRVLVIVRLTRVADGSQIWSERYEKRLGDIFALQGEIASAVAARLQRSFGVNTPQGTRPEVYDRYLAARQLVRERREIALSEADRLLREAIRIDPNYAPALAELAQVTMLRANHPTAYGNLPVGQARAQAERFARAALRLDPNLGDGYAALGFLNLTSDERALPFYRKAVELSPQRSEFHRWLGQALFDRGRHDDALNEYRRAVAIDPLWSLNYDHLIGALYQLGREQEGQQQARRFLALSTDQRAKLQLLQSISKLENRAADWLRYSRALHQAYPDERQFRFNLSSALAFLGERREARALVANDPVGRASLDADWAGLAGAARSMGRDYWDIAGSYWHSGPLLIASGRFHVIVDLYDEAWPLVASGVLKSDAVALPETVIALRRAGRTAETARLVEQIRQRAERMPNKGWLGNDRVFNLAIADVLSGRRHRLLELLDAKSRTRPLQLGMIPAMSLRHDPLLAALIRDPRFEAIDERLRGAINAERAKAGLAPITKDQWISDERTLLTKN